MLDDDSDEEEMYMHTDALDDESCDAPPYMCNIQITGNA